MPRPFPNILFLMSDEHRADVAGFAGNDIVRTPTLDWLAADGFVFDNAYTPSPACCPARQCMMSGQLPKTCSCEGWKDLAPHSMTFARRFTQEAYHTTCSGKLHHFGLDMMQGWLHRPAGLGDALTSAHSFPPLNMQAFERFNQPLSAVKWSDAKEIQRAGSSRPHHYYRDKLSVDAACHWIDEYFVGSNYDRQENHRPMLLKVSLLQPHYPYHVCEEKFSYYLNRVKPYVVSEPPAHGVLNRRAVRAGKDVTEREIRRATAAYYGMIETVDEMFEQVLGKLRHAGQDLDEWIIVYTTDHGEMLGEHGLWEKQRFYEGSARVPLIIRWPAGLGRGGRIGQNVNLCDLFATLCEMAGIDAPAGLDSRSLVSLMRGQVEGWRNETVSQYETDQVMIKQDHLKYQYYGPAYPELLFDLQADPAEEKDFLNDPAYADAVQRFRQRLGQLGHGPDADKHYVNAGYHTTTGT